MQLLVEHINNHSKDWLEGVNSFARLDVPKYTDSHAREWQQDEHKPCDPLNAFTLIDSFFCRFQLSDVYHLKLPVLLFNDMRLLSSLSGLWSCHGSQSEIRFWTTSSSNLSSDSHSGWPNLRAAVIGASDGYQHIFVDEGKKAQSLLSYWSWDASKECAGSSILSLSYCKSAN